MKPMHFLCLSHSHKLTSALCFPIGATPVPPKKKTKNVEVTGTRNNASWSFTGKGDENRKRMRVWVPQVITSTHTRTSFNATRETTRTHSIDEHDIVTTISSTYSGKRFYNFSLDKLRALCLCTTVPGQSLLKVRASMISAHFTISHITLLTLGDMWSLGCGGV